MATYVTKRLLPTLLEMARWLHSAGLMNARSTVDLIDQVRAQFPLDHAVSDRQLTRYITIARRVPIALLEELQESDVSLFHLEESVKLSGSPDKQALFLRHNANVRRRPDLLAGISSPLPSSGDAERSAVKVIALLEESLSAREIDSLLSVWEQTTLDAVRAVWANKLRS